MCWFVQTTSTPSTPRAHSRRRGTSRRASSTPSGAPPSRRTTSLLVSLLIGLRVQRRLRATKSDLSRLNPLNSWRIAKSYMTSQGIGLCSTEAGDIEFNLSVSSIRLVAVQCSTHPHTALWLSSSGARVLVRPEGVPADWLRAREIPQQVGMQAHQIHAQLLPVRANLKIILFGFKPPPDLSPGPVCSE